MEGVYVHGSLGGRTEGKRYVDTVVSDLFFSKDSIAKLGLKVEKECGRLKTLNSGEVPTTGVARDVDF